MSYFIHSLFAVSLFFGLFSEARAQNIYIEDVTVLSGKGKVEHTNVLIQGDTIVAMGKGTQSIKPQTIRIAGKGKILTAGLIATNTRLGLVEISAVESTNEGYFSSEHPVHAAYSILDGYNPQSIVIPIARMGGITSTIAAPTGGLISGQSSWLTLAHGSVAYNVVKAGSALHVTLGERSTGVGQGSRGYAMEKLRALLQDAKHYTKNKAAYNRGQTRIYGTSHQNLEALQQVLLRKLPMVVSVNRQSDIAAVLRLAKQFNIRIILQNAAEAWMLAKEIAMAKVPVILNPKDNLPDSFDKAHVVDDLATRLLLEGVTVIISPIGGASSARTLRQLAGLAVAHGLSKEQALTAITTAPAEVFGVKRGLLKVKEKADVVLWSGDPLELSSRAEVIIIGGRIQSMKTHQSELLKRYK